MSGKQDDSAGRGEASSEHTFSLVARAARGDLNAENKLVERYWQALRRWAHGRLPPTARERGDTEDLVQVTLLKTLKGLGTFEPQREGAFTSYLHRILLNQIRDEIRRASRRPFQNEVPENLPETKRRGPLGGVLDKEFAERYETALRQLPETQSRAVVLRLEFGHSFQEVADKLGKPSPDAARMTYQRAVRRLSELLYP